MTLKDIKGIIDYTFDIADDEIDGSFYIELDEINEDYLSNIEIVKIGKEIVTCRLTNFLQRLANFHPSKITTYIDDNYYDGEQKDYLKTQLTKAHGKGIITDDGGSAVYHFINYDMCDFLTV
jgi:hypothetical protein